MARTQRAAGRESRRGKARRRNGRRWCAEREHAARQTPDTRPPPEHSTRQHAAHWDGWVRVGPRGELEMLQCIQCPPEMHSAIAACYISSAEPGVCHCLLAANMPQPELDLLGADAPPHRPMRSRFATLCCDRFACSEPARPSMLAKDSAVPSVAPQSLLNCSRVCCGHTARTPAMNLLPPAPRDGSWRPPAGNGRSTDVQQRSG